MMLVMLVCTICAKVVPGYVGNNLHLKIDCLIVTLFYCRGVKTWNWICNPQASGKIGGKLRQEVKKLELT